MCDYLTTRKSGIVLRRYANDIVKEVFRKVIHLCAAFIPFFLKYFYLPVLVLLSSVLVLYIIAEILRYKGFSVSMLFDGRLGGDIANVTGRGLWSNGMHKALEQYRGRQVVWEGVVQVGVDEEGNPVYEKNTTPITIRLYLQILLRMVLIFVLLI